MNGWGGKQMKEEQLIELKKQLELEEKRIQRSEGKLESIYEELISILNMDKNASKKEISKAVQKEVKTIKSKIIKEKKRRDTLLDEIEGETSKWED